MLQFEKTYTRWSGERILRHILYWLAWLIFYAAVNSSFGQYSFATWLKVELAIMTIKLPFTYFLIYILVPKYLIQKRYLTFFIYTFCFAYIGGVLIQQLYGWVIIPCFFETKEWYSGKKVIYLVLDLIYIASLPTILKLLQRQFQQEKLTRQIAEQKLGAELKLLKNQLHPHFLFNTLNNLYGMVLTQHPKAADVVVQLSDIMSYMLYECERETIDLEKDLANLKNYVELEKVRYGKRLEISFDTGGDLQGKVIAPLLLIPFVENAFKHGVGKNELHSWVVINFQVEDHQLYFSIENSLPEETEADDLETPVQSGIGLVNVRKRLELLYPKQHHLEINHGETYCVKLKLQLND